METPQSSLMSMFAGEEPSSTPPSRKRKSNSSVTPTKNRDTPSSVLTSPLIQAAVKKEPFIKKEARKEAAQLSRNLVRRKSAPERPTLSEKVDSKPKPRRTSASPPRKRANVETSSPLIHQPEPKKTKKARTLTPELQFVDDGSGRQKLDSQSLQYSLSTAKKTSLKLASVLEDRVEPEAHAHVILDSVRKKLRTTRIPTSYQPLADPAQDSMAQVNQQREREVQKSSLLISKLKRQREQLEVHDLPAAREALAQVQGPKKRKRKQQQQPPKQEAYWSAPPGTMMRFMEEMGK